MSDKDDLRQLTADVREMSAQMQNLANQVNAVLQKHDALAERAKHLEDFREKARPNMWLLDGAKVILGVIGATILAGLGAGVVAGFSGAYSLGQLSSDVKHQGDDITALKKDIDELRADLKQVPRAREGKIVKVTDDKLILEGDNGMHRTMTLTADSRVTIDDKPAKLADIRAQADIRASVTELDGKVTRIDVKTGRP